MPLNAQPSCGWPFKPVSSRCESDQGCQFVREEEQQTRRPLKPETARAALVADA
jgi:hypothetical protein